jgi:hypothetical protein
MIKRQLGRSKIGEAHTLEFRKAVRHDTNFNNIEKVRKETFFAATLIRNPESVWGLIGDLCERLLEVISHSRGSPSGSQFIAFLEKDTGLAGQFGRITGIIQIEMVLSCKRVSSVLFVQKILLLKSFGAYIIDFAIKSPHEHGFMFGVAGDEHVNFLINKFRPPSLFAVRGRTGIKSNTHRDDIGIMDEQQFSALENKEFLLIDGLSKSRPLFRTFTHQAINGVAIEAPFVSRTFDKDLPLIGAVSGSTSCIMVGAHTLKSDIDDDANRVLAKCAVAFLVGGGYHSATEVIDVACPGYDYLS